MLKGNSDRMMRDRGDRGDRGGGRDRDREADRMLPPGVRGSGPPDADRSRSHSHEHGDNGSRRRERESERYIKL